MSPSLRSFLFLAAAVSGAACTQQPGHGPAHVADDDDDGGGDDDGSGTTVPSGVTLLPTSFLDESNDTIDFSNANLGPIHAHRGSPIDLTVGCPTIHVYDYLTDSAGPLFGTETSSNPIAWKLSIDGASGGMFHVLDDAGAVMRDWSPVDAAANGVYTVALHRDQVPSLSVTAGKVHVEVQFTDAAGMTSTTQLCVNHQPLAAPLQVATPDKTPTSDPSSIFGWSLPADSPISRLINASDVGPSVMETRVTQATGEAIPVEMTFDQGAITFDRSQGGDIIDVLTPTSVSCGNLCIGGHGTCTVHHSDDPRCLSVAAGFNPAESTTSGPVTTGRWSMTLVDATTRAPVGGCTATTGGTRCTIPARGKGEAARTYAFVVKLDSLAELGPNASDGVGEFVLAGLTYTGRAPVTKTGCGLMHQDAPDPDDGFAELICEQALARSTYVALDHGDLAFAGAKFHLKAGAPLVDVPYLSGGTVTSGAITWDSGNDDLPGAN